MMAGLGTEQLLDCTANRRTITKRTAIRKGNISKVAERRRHMRKSTVAKKRSTKKAAPGHVDSTIAVAEPRVKSGRAGRTNVRDSSRMVRIDARIPSHVKEIVQYAASLQGRSQTDFVITAIHEAAQKVIDDNSVIRLSLADQMALADALLNDKPPEITPGLARLQRALREHDKRVKSI